MPMHVLQFWRTEIYVGNLHVCLIIITIEDASDLQEKVPA